MSTYTFSQKIITFLTRLAIAGGLVFLLLSFNHMPDEIPSHWNGAGEIDSYSSKVSIFLMPFFQLLLYGVSSIGIRYPDICNIPVKLTGKNRLAAHSLIRSMGIALRLETILIFSYTLFGSIFSFSLGGWFLPVVIVVMGATLWYYCWMIRKAG